MVVNLVSGILKSIKSNTKVQSLKFSTKYNSKTLCTFFFLLQKSMKTLRLYSDPKGYCRIWAIQVMCRCEGYGFQAVYSRIVYINQNVWVQNRVSFFRKLIRYSSIGGISGVYSSIGQQNSAELVLVQVKELVKGSRIPAAHLHPEIPKVPPPPPSRVLRLRRHEYHRQGFCSDAKDGCRGAISETERSCAPQISRVEVYTLQLFNFSGRHEKLSGMCVHSVKLTEQN